MASDDNTPLGNLAGIAGFIFGCIICWNATENVVVALIGGFVLAGIGVAVGNAAWRIIIMIIAIAILAFQIQVRREVTRGVASTVMDITAPSETKDSGSQSNLERLDGVIATFSTSTGAEVIDGEPAVEQEADIPVITVRLWKPEPVLIKVTNGCDRPIRMAIRYRKPDRQWSTEWWWSFDPGEEAHLGDGEQTIKTTYKKLLYYAETTDGSNFKWTDDYSATVDGRDVGMREFWDQEGQVDLELTCD